MTTAPRTATVTRVVRLDPVGIAAVLPGLAFGAVAGAARRGLERLGARAERLRGALLGELSRRLDVLVPVVLDEVVRRTDLTALVVGNVDLDRVVAAVDLDAAVARVDLSAVLDRVDATAFVLERVDLDVVVRAVLDRLDLVGLAEGVIDGVDLPAIIRSSTGAMASDTVEGVRLQSMVADEMVGRTVDRLLFRHDRTVEPR